MIETLTIQNKDYYVYAGEISRSGYNQITRECLELTERKDGAVLLLLTYGGDPHAAFRIARALQHYYKDGFECFIPSYCKSAGTLLSVGATRLIMDDKAELGPLDIQMNNATELGERTSGLDLPQALEALRNEATNTFSKIMVQSRGWGISTKLCSEIATGLSSGLISPIYNQLDPLKIGEMYRANSIAFDYGIKLVEERRDSSNISIDKIAELIKNYPSHNFVIDRKEARKLFKKVVSKDNVLPSEYDSVFDVFINAFESGVFDTTPPATLCLNSMLKELKGDDNDNTFEQDGCFQVNGASSKDNVSNRCEEGNKEPNSE